MGSEERDRYKTESVRHFIRIEDRSRYKRPEVAVTKGKPAQPKYSPFQPVDVYGVTPKVEVEQPKIEIIQPQPFAKPAEPRLQKSQVLRRESLTYKEPTSRKPKLKSLFQTQHVLVGMAVFIFSLGIFVSVQTFMTNNTAKGQVEALSKKSQSQQATNSAAADVPDEAKPTGGGQYSVAPNLPKYIKIPKIGVDARVKALGTKSNNELKAPSNIYDAGWYQASAKPGDLGSLGAMLIDGHVHGPTKPAVFVGLKKLVAGDTIQVVRGDNQVFNYKVMRVQNYDADKLDMGMMLTSAQPGVAGLNIITCGGAYNRSTNEYKERTAVFAIQI